jgi:hypothetical protein
MKYTLGTLNEVNFGNCHKAVVAPLRDVDLIRQLADSLHAAVLPHARRREADALRSRVETELGAGSRLALTAVEIEERKDFAGVLARLAIGGEAE